MFSIWDRVIDVMNEGCTNNLEHARVGDEDNMPTFTKLDEYAKAYVSG